MEKTLKTRNDFKDREGSKSADAWRFLHKEHAPDSFYGLDLDFVLIAKKPFPFIVAVIDIKVKGHEWIGFSHIIAYNTYCLAPEPYRAPVYIVQVNSGFERMDKSEHRMDIYRYIMGNPYPDDTPYTVVEDATQLSWEDFVKWEGKLRDDRRSEIEEWERRQSNQYRTGQMAQLQIEQTMLSLWQN